MHAHASGVNARRINDTLQLAWKNHNVKALMRIGKGTCGLKEVGALSKKQIWRHLHSHGCIPSKFTPGIWKYDATKNMSTLVVEGFGVKCIRKSNDEQLMQAQDTLKKLYQTLKHPTPDKP